MIGVCVVSGNVRRSAELLLGRIDDETFLNLKNVEQFPERNSYDPKAPGWGWMSNNSVEVSVGQDLSKIIDGIAVRHVDFPENNPGRLELFEKFQEL